MDRRSMLMGTLAAPLLVPSVLVPSVLAQSSQDRPERSFFELRWFYLRNGGTAPQLSSLLKLAWAPAAERSGFRVEGIFQPAIGEQAPSLLMLSSFASAQDAVMAMDRLLADEPFAAAYAKANVPQPGFIRMESTLLRAFEGMPAVIQPDGSQFPQVFELRTYESNSQISLRKKLEMFNSGEIAVFQRLGMQPVFFGEAIFGERLPHLTYMLAFQSLAERERLWKAFVADPGFTRLRSQPGYSDAEIVSTISNMILSPLYHPGPALPPASQGSVK